MWKTIQIVLYECRVFLKGKKMQCMSLQTQHIPITRMSKTKGYKWQYSGLRLKNAVAKKISTT